MYCWLLIVTILVNFAYNETYIKGVSKSMMSLYQNANDKFTCLDKSKVIPYKYVNDDYCDCHDASDEPGSSACNNGMFVCRNTGYREHTILSIDVKDGTCNCCDGSDEDPGVCPDTCAKLAEEERQRRLALINKIQTGKSKINEFLSKLDEFTNNIKNKIIQEETNLQENIKLTNDNTQFRESVSKQLEHAKSHALQQWNENVKIEYASKVFKQIDLNEDKFISTDEILASDVTKFFQINDLIVASTDAPLSEEAFKNLWISHLEIPLVTEDTLKSEARRDIEEEGHDDIDATEDDKEKESDDDSDEDEYLTEPGKRIEHQQESHPSTEPTDDDDDEKEYGEDGMEVKKSKPSRKHRDLHRRHPPPLKSREHKHHNEFDQIYKHYQQELNNPKNDEINNLTETLESNDEKVKQLLDSYKSISQELNRLKSFFTIDFGPDKAYTMLFDICLTKTFHHFNYTICPFYLGFQQDSYEKHVIGYWKEWSNDASPYSKMIYSDGDFCYGETKRSFEIMLSCNHDHDIEMIEEIRTCHYLIDLKTPAACVSVPVPEIHDEL